MTLVKVTNLVGYKAVPSETGGGEEISHIAGCLPDNAERLQTYLNLLNSLLEVQGAGPMTKFMLVTRLISRVFMFLLQAQASFLRFVWLNSKYMQPKND